MGGRPAAPLGVGAPAAFAERLERAGCDVPGRVSLTCTGGLKVTPLHHAGWLVVEGVPWLWRRGRDLLPYAVAIVYRSRAGLPKPPRYVGETAGAEAVGATTTASSG